MIFHWPVAALDQHIWVAIKDARQRRVFIEPGDQRDAFQCGEQRHAVGQLVDRPFVAFAQALDRGIRIDGDDQAGAERARLRQIGDMAAVQDVKTAIGKHQRVRQLRYALWQFVRRDNLGLECRGRVVSTGHFLAGGPSSARACSGLMISNTRTTFCTPPVVRAISAAASASAWVTRPSRKTMPASVTTLT